MNCIERYPIEVFWNEEDEGFIAVAPDLPGCSAFGETHEAAVKEIHHAIDAWIEAARPAGNAIPKPSTRSPYSGKFLVRMPRDLHEKLAIRANQEGVSLNYYVVYLLTASLNNLVYRSITEDTTIGLAKADDALADADFVVDAAALNPRPAKQAATEKPARSGKMRRVRSARSAG